jgi:hypothetical protein
VCTVEIMVSCSAAAGSFRGPGSTCVPLVCCRADFNRSGQLSVQDIFDFLAAYFAQSPTADVNGSQLVSVQDIFAFLASYFAGCA